MKSTILLASLCTTLAGCASIAYNLSNPSMALAQTPGEYFRQFLAKADAECREKQLGPYLPSDEPQGSPRRANATCRFMFLKPWQPGDSPESAYAHSLKLPPPHDKPVDVYKSGMGPREYFEALCAAQAGEFIFRKVADVSGVLEIRRRLPESSERNRHLTAFEDPATYAHWQSNAPLSMAFGTPYEYLERPLPNGKIEHHVGDRADRYLRTRVSVLDRSQSKYGFIWRGIHSSTQLENGIAGGEMIVLDLDTQEVLGFKRAFVLRWLGRFPTEQSISATGFERIAHACTSVRAKPEKGAYQDFRDFLMQVVVPAQRKTGEMK